MIAVHLKLAVYEYEDELLPALQDLVRNGGTLMIGKKKFKVQTMEMHTEITMRQGRPDKKRARIK